MGTFHWVLVNKFNACLGVCFHYDFFDVIVIFYFNLIVWVGFVPNIVWSCICQENNCKFELDFSFFSSPESPIPSLCQTHQLGSNLFLSGGSSSFWPLEKKKNIFGLLLVIQALFVRTLRCEFHNSDISCYKWCIHSPRSKIGYELT